MVTEHLKKCEEAQQRAKMYLSFGESANACAAYLEAAEHMMAFAKGLQGQQKRDAQQLTEQLLLKAKQIKATAGSVPHAPETVPAPVKEQPQASNRSAISRDIESYQRTAGKNAQASA